MEKSNVVKVVEFAEAHASEIKTFTNDMKTKRGPKRPFQTLPHYLRRRSMSHSLKRVPKRVKFQTIKEFESAPPKQPKPSRKQRRKPNRISSDYETRKKKTKWLETHIWHAKRMKMEKLWGYKLAKKPTMKGIKSAFNSTSKKCSIYDSSFLNCIEFSAKSKEQIISLLKNFCDPSFCCFENQMYMDGRRSGEGVLYTPNRYPFGCIGPVSFLWRSLNPAFYKDEFQKLWIWIHPSFLAHFLDLVRSLSAENSVEIKLMEGELQKFEIRGPSSLQILSKVLIPDLEQNSAQICEIWKILSNVNGASPIKNGSVFCMNVKDPRITFPPKKKAEFNGNFVEISNAVNKLSLNWPLEVCLSNIWLEDIRKQFFEKPLDPTEFQINQQRAKLIEPSSPLNPAIMIIKREELEDGKNGNFNGGWDLIVPCSWGIPFGKVLYMQVRIALLFERED